MEIKELRRNDVKNKKKIDDFLSTIKNVDVKQTTQWNELRDEKKYFLFILETLKEYLHISEKLFTIMVI